MGCAQKRTLKRRRELIKESGPHIDQIWDTGLVESSLSAASLYELGETYHEASARIKRYKGFVLGYVTPW